jgi:hypothetical protein
MRVNSKGATRVFKRDQSPCQGMERDQYPIKRFLPIRTRATATTYSNERGPTGAALNWRSQPKEPAAGFKGFHRIKKFDHNLMEAIAYRTFECPNVKA